MHGGCAYRCNKQRYDRKSSLPNNFYDHWLIKRVVALSMYICLAADDSKQGLIYVRLWLHPLGKNMQNLVLNP